MKIHGLFSIGYLVAILSLTALTFGSSDTAVITSRGAVALNGESCPSTTALFSGDRVVTSGGGTATISSPGSTVLIPSNSQVVFKGGVLDIAAGTARISTTKGMQAHLDQYLVAPASGNAAKFEIEKTESSLAIHASSGALTVSAPEKTFTLAEGATATATLDSATGKTTDAPPNPAISVTNASHKYWKWTVIVAGAAGAGVIVGAAAVSNQGAPYCGTGACSTPPSVSPHSPCVCPKP